MARQKRNDSLLRGLLDSFRDRSQKKLVHAIWKQGIINKDKVQTVQELASKKGKEEEKGEETPPARADSKSDSAEGAEGVKLNKNQLLETLKELGVESLERRDLQELLLASFPLFREDKDMNSEGFLQRLLAVVSVQKSMLQWDCDINNISWNQMSLLLFHAESLQELVGEVSDGENGGVQIPFGITEEEQPDKARERTFQRLNKTLAEIEGKISSLEELRELLVERAAVLDSAALLAVKQEQWDKTASCVELEKKAMDRCGKRIDQS
jgi:hypothetical protein